MWLHRVFPYLASASPATSGHPDYLWPGQGAGRWDNPSQYTVWYLASDTGAAIGEVFGDLRQWDDAMFAFPAVPGSRRALGIYSLPDDLPLLDFDDANALVVRSLRPTQIVSPNRSATQQIALGVFEERKANGSRAWAGLSWWSSRRSYWPVHCIWGAPPNCEDVVDLDVNHPAVQDAASALSKPVA